MLTKWIILLILLPISLTASGQIPDTLVHIAPPDTSLPVVDAATNALLADLTTNSELPPLLPDRMIFTERVLWGKKGLLRLTNMAPLTTQGRTNELKIRRTMLIAHQIGGFVTLAGFVVQGILGAKLYNAQGQEYVDTKRWHERSATFINVSYGVTTLLSLTPPPPVIGAKRGLTWIKVHKYLAIAHLAGMIATNVLAEKIQIDYSLKPYHRAVAYGTFGVYAASVLALTF